MEKETLINIEKTVGKGYSEEKLSKELGEQSQIASEILQKQEEDRMKSILTNPSAIALSTTKKDAGEGLSAIKRTAKQLFILYLTNQFIARAVNVRADTLISKGYEIIGKDKKGEDACKELIDNSGGINLFWQSSVNSVTKDTPILIKYLDNSIDIIELPELYKDKEDVANIGRYSTQEIRDTQVMTDEGWKNINYIFRHKIDEDIYKIRTGTGLAKVTHDHSLISKGEKKHSKDLKVGSVIDTIEFSNDGINTDYGKDMTKDLAWLYGFFVSDGTAGIYKTGKQWKITNKNRDFLEKALLIIQETYDKTAKIYWYDDIGHVAFSPIKNEDAFNWYLENCYTPNRFKRIPKVVLNSFKEIHEAFMEGYWAGDGAKYTSWEHSRYATNSYTLIAGIEHIVKSFGKTISLNSIKNKENVYLLSIRDGFETKQVCERLEQLNSIMETEYNKGEALSDDEINILTDIPRRTISYYRSMNNIPSKYQRQNTYDTENTQYMFYKDNHLDYLTKRKQDGIIEEIKKEEYNDYVYDIATENHRFVAGVGGLLHHNTDIAGDGFQEKVYNVNKTKIIRIKHIHPITITFRRDRFDRIIVGKNKEPIGYVQYYLDDLGINREKNIPKDIISHLRFNTLGDEFTGISILQPVYSTAVRLMNMEYSAAEAAVKAANPLIVGTCNTKSPMQIAQWGTILGRISGRDQIFVPEDMKIEFKSPGQQNFTDYADYFLNAVVSATGVPRSVLLGASGAGSGNRAEGVVLTRHFYSMIRSNQKYMEDFFNKIFEEYAELAGFEAPKLVFNDIAEDAALASKSAIELYDAGLITLREAREMVGLDKAGTSQLEPSLLDQVKKSDMGVAFPEEPGKREGSQAGVKTKQKASPLSEVSPATK